MATLNQGDNTNQPARGRYNNLIILAAILIIGLLIYIVSASARRDETDIDRSTGTATIGSPPAADQVGPNGANTPSN